MDYTESEKLAMEHFRTVRDRWSPGDAAWRTLHLLGFCPTRDEVTTLCREAGFYNLGDISATDFLEVLSRWKRTREDERRLLLEAFSVIDKSGDGLVERDDFIKTMQTFSEEMSAEQLEELVKEAVRKDDGRIDPKEIVESLMQM